MRHDDLKWKSSFDNFCLEHTIQWEKKMQLAAIYGRAVFDVLYSRIYHEFIKKSLWDFYQDTEIDLVKLSTHIHNLYHEDLFFVPPQIPWNSVSLESIFVDPNFDFKTMGDGEKIEKLPLHTSNEMIQSTLWTKEKIVCMFKVPDNLKWLKETILWSPHIYKWTSLYQALENKIPSSFHIDWEKQENTLYKVTNSPFIR